LLLIPVNLAGVAQSLKQAFTGRVAVFARTPKVKGRTSSPRFYLVAVAVIVVLSCLAAISDLQAGKYAFSLFGFSNAGLYVYAMIRFVGIRESWADLRGGMEASADPVASQTQQSSAQRQLA
jgi:hypothetical protein